MPTVLGRQRIRNEVTSSLPGNPLQPVAARPNRTTRLWTLDAAEGSLLASLRDSYLSGFETVDARDAFKAAAIKKNRFTEDGLKESLREFSVAQTAKIKQARNRIEKARERVAELEQEVALAPPDQSEAASRLRDRVWQQLQRIPAGERDMQILKLAQGSPIVGETIREMPRDLAGVSGSIYDQIVGTLMETTHGPKLAELEALREAIDVASSSVEAADEDLRAEIGVFHVADWTEMTKHVAPASHIHWLRKGPGGAVNVVDMNTQRVRPATPEQIETGRYFNSLDEYNSANAAA
jgi:hypothetical protein